MQLEPKQTPQEPPAISSATSLIQTPAGPMGLLTISSGTAQFAIMLSANQANELANIFPKQLTELSAAIRRATLGLIVPGTPGNTPPPSQNGHPKRP